MNPHLPRPKRDALPLSYRPAQNRCLRELVAGNDNSGSLALTLGLTITLSQTFNISPSVMPVSDYYKRYLRSDHWQNLRLEKLVCAGTLCHFCRQDSPSNDVHHVKYRESLKETKLKDLRVLCRRCHDLVHEVLRRFPAIQKLKHGNERWRVTEQHVHRILGHKISMPNEPSFPQSILREASARLKLARSNLQSVANPSRKDTPLSENLAKWFMCNQTCTDEDMLRRAAIFSGEPIH